jgi:hypothetical protein
MAYYSLCSVMYGTTTRLFADVSSVRIDFGVSYTFSISAISHFLPCSQPSTMASHTILVGSYTDQITTLVFTEGVDGASAKLEHKGAVTVGHHPSWLAVHPASTKEKTIVFTGLEQSEGIIAAVEFDADGNGKVVGQTTSGGRDPCTLDVTKDGKEVVVGNVRVYALDAQSPRS